MNDLINTCYENEFGLDLRAYHAAICKIKPNEQQLINRINKSDRFLLNDGLSSNFRLIIHKNLLYLLGENSCYPCSNVIETAHGSHLNWVQCIIIPGKRKILGETDIRKSAIIISLFSDLIPTLQNPSVFFDFIEKIEYTFEDCEWFKRIHSISLYVKLASFWNYREKATVLFDNGLLYPLELVLFTILNRRELRSVQLQKHFMLSLAESTEKIFNQDEIRMFLHGLSSTEVENIFGVNFVLENIQLENLNDETLANLLELDGTQRYGMFVNDVYYLYHMRQSADTIFKTTNFKKQYLKLVAKNFRVLENKMRKVKGFQSVGSFYMEKLLFDKLKESFPSLTIVSQYSPKWLYPQRIDIFILEINLAVEYHGAQHFMAIDFFGGADGLVLRQKLDLQKRRKCEENGINYHEITYEEDFDFALNNLKSRISLLLDNI